MTSWLRRKTDYLHDFIISHPFTFTIILLNGIISYPLYDWTTIRYTMIKPYWKQFFSINIESIARGELYRFFTFSFVHFGPTHHFYTTLLILGFVSNLEREIGWRKTMIVYFSSTLFIFFAIPIDYLLLKTNINTVMWENIWTHNYTGASGAAWGCGGAYILRGWKKKEKPFLWFTLINFLFGLFRKPIQGISDYNADVAHYTAALGMLILVAKYDFLGIRSLIMPEMKKRPD